MKHIKLALLITLITGQLYAQKTKVNVYQTVDKKTLQIPDSLTYSTDLIASYISSNFSNDDDRVRAVYIWITSNIQYDIENMYAINFYEKEVEKIEKPLRTRKGICENYAALFTDICTKSGIKSYVVTGYTNQNGFADYIPHAWNAALIDSSWFLFDPTWGSGYMNAGKFYSKINNNYFKVSPSTHIKTHIPFDYLWQFLPYPVTNQEFYEGKTQLNSTKPFFNFNDSLQAHEQLDKIEQFLASAYRIEKNGIKNALVFDQLHHLQVVIENDKISKTVNLYNAAIVDYNDGVKYINNFIIYRNDQFLPKKTDPEIQAMIDKAATKMNAAKTKLAQISTTDENTLYMIRQITESIDEALLNINEQQDWLTLYFSKSKTARRSMFYKISWFGVPLN